MKQSLILFLLLSALIAQSQEVISSAGESFSQGDISIDFTLGELAIESFGNNPKITQGFHQGPQGPLGILEWDSASFSVYPNPTSDQISLDFSGSQVQISHVLLYDLGGRLIDRFEIGNGLHPLSLAHLPAGSYVLQAFETTQSSFISILIQKQ